jgi:hypothetical protein
MRFQARRGEVSSKKNLFLGEGEAEEEKKEKAEEKANGREIMVASYWQSAISNTTRHGRS